MSTFAYDLGHSAATVVTGQGRPAQANQPVRATIKSYSSAKNSRTTMTGDVPVTAQIQDFVRTNTVSPATKSCHEGRTRLYSFEVTDKTFATPARKTCEQQNEIIPEERKPDSLRSNRHRLINADIPTALLQLASVLLLNFLIKKLSCEADQKVFVLPAHHAPCLPGVQGQS